ncbi:uncharacterized protein TNCV_3139211 [Trichonephila clavipes]|nr:uncharacterized protein TNCV_3139211 [Trichonephila clavipes]
MICACQTETSHLIDQHILMPPQEIEESTQKYRKQKLKSKWLPHRPRKSTPTELTTDEEDMIMYDVQAEELEPNPEDKFAVMECFVNNPSEYMRALTPTRFRNSSN